MGKLHLAWRGGSVDFPGLAGVAAPASRAALLLGLSDADAAAAGGPRGSWRCLPVHPTCRVGGIRRGGPDGRRRCRGTFLGGGTPFPPRRLRRAVRRHRLREFLFLGQEERLLQRSEEQ